MKILKREQIPPINVVAGDSIQLTYDDSTGHRVVLEKMITETHFFTEAEIVEDDTPEEYKLGGFFIERK